MNNTKAKPATKEQEITKVEVIKELPLEKVIDLTLTKNNVTKKVLAALKDKYMSKGESGELELKPEFKLKSPTDKETYLTLYEERKSVRKVGIITEKLCKEGRADAIKAQKAWLAKENEILDEVALVQNPLDAQIKIFEDEQARIEEEEAKKREEVFMQRQSELLKMGAVFANGCYNLNEVSIEMSSIKEADEEIYTDSILPKFQKQYEILEAEKVAAQKKREEEEKALREQQEKLREEQNKFREEQEKFQAQQREAQRIENEKKEQAEKEERQRKINLQNQRLALLLPVNPTGADVNMATLWELEEDKFQEILESKKADFKEKQAAETLRLQEEAATKERLRIEQEQKDAEIKRKQEEQRLIEEAAKASDKEKWAVFVNALRAVAIPEFKSNIYKGKLGIAKEKLEEISDL